MNARVVGFVVLLALLIAILVLWRAWDEPAEPLTPAPASSAESRPEETQLGLAVNDTPAGRIEASDVPAPRTDAPAPAAFALVKVLVVEKESRAPRADIDVYCSFDDGKDVHALGKATARRGKPFEKVLTDSDGRVELEVPPNLEIKVHASGMEKDAGSDQAVLGPLEPGTELEVVLSIATANDLPFWMKFVAEESSGPLAGVLVSAQSRGKETLRLTSDAAGLVHYEGRTWNTAMLQIGAEGRPTKYLAPEPGHERSDLALVIALEAAASLRIRVVDGAGAAVPDAYVDLRTPGYNLSLSSQTTVRINAPDALWRGTTDASGTAKIGKLPPRVPIQAEITRPRKWMSPEALVFAPGESREVEWKLTNGCEVHGIVLDQAQTPVVEREIWLRRATRKAPATLLSYSSEKTVSAKTDAAGRFRFSEVSPGFWWIGPSVREYGTAVREDDVASMAQVVEVVEAQTDLEVTIRVDRGLFIRGRLLDSNGEPSKTGSVIARDDARKVFASADMEKKDGSFVLGPLSAGHYSLVGRAGLTGDADSEPLEVDPGTESVELRLRPGLKLSGRVLGANGAPVVAKLWLTQRGSKTFGVHGVSCRPDGTFSKEGLLAGAYDLVAHTTGGEVGILESIEVGASPVSELVLKLAAGGHVNVRHAGPDEHVSISVSSGGVLIDTAGVKRDATEVMAAPAGSVVVRATYYEDDRRVVERVVQVEAGKSVDVVFEKGAH